MKKNVVCKFGGTSLACSANIKRVSEIVEHQNNRLVVVSAPGKRDKNDTKITDMLINAFNASRKGLNFDEHFYAFKQRYLDIIKELQLTNINLEDDFNKLYMVIEAHVGYDYVVSRGEYFSARIFAAYTGYKFLDASEFIVFDSDGQVNLKQTKADFERLTSKDECYVIPGFYGRTEQGEIKVFSRGGSDITGAIVAVIAECGVYENWTDVDGYLMADPRVCENPKLIKKLSYRELRELSYMGSSVLHEDCVRFLRENDIVLNLRNTFNSDCEGSFIISDKAIEKADNLTGIAAKKGFSIIYIEKFDINESLGIIEIIAQIFKNLNIPIEHIPTGIDSISVIVESKFLTETVSQKLFDGINSKIEPDRIELISNISLFSIVGRVLKDNIMVERQVFECIFNSNVKISTLNMCASGVSIIFGVEEHNHEEMLQFMYNSLFNKSV